MSAQLSPEATVEGHGYRPTSGDHSDTAGGPIPAVAGQWRPVDPHRPRTPKQLKRALRKDRRRRRCIAERAQVDPTLTAGAVRVLGVLLQFSDDSAKPVWPMMGTVAGGVDMAVRSTRRSVAELETAGYLERFMRPAEHRRNLSNQYYFRLPPGPPPRWRPDHRRRPRRRPQKPRSHRGTLGTSGTDRFIEPPGQAGAAKPGPPPRNPGQRRNPPAPAQRPPLRPIQQPANPPPAEPTAVRSAIDAARAKLRTLDQERPIGPYGPKRRPASGGPGFSR
jgi:DNA-binding MarR family transcriptional regulator